MEILGIGPLELVVVLLLLLAFFGPDRLPEMGAKLGKAVRSMRQATRDFSREIDEARQSLEAPAKEIVEPIKEIAQPIQEIAQPFQDVRTSAQALTQAAKSMSDPGKAIRESVMQAVKPGPAQANTPVNPGSETLAEQGPESEEAGTVPDVLPPEGNEPVATDTAESDASNLARTPALSAGEKVPTQSDSSLQG